MTMVAVWAVLFLGSNSAGVGPPESTLSTEGQSQTGGTGTFCWHEERRFWFDGGQCVDMVGVWVPAEPLKVTRGAAMTFQFGGDTAPAEFRVGIGSAQIDPDTSGGMHLYEHLMSGARERQFTQSGTQAEIVADLLLGDYVVTVTVWVPTDEFVAPSGQRLQGTNSGMYGFHIVVEEFVG